MSPPTMTSLSCTDLVLQWTEFATLAEQGRTAVTNYNLRYALASSSTWQEAPLGSGYLTLGYTLPVSLLTALSGTPGTAF